MVHFVKLRLTGFKSFVDHTELPILPGKTGVIGPNGCGKSNLLEALRWVMGETSAKAVRGSGMEDVIFAGSDLRPARNFAEVSLHMDNTERRAPEGFNDTDEMEITRRIARDLGSTYKYNSKDIRARDAQRLFADASTGANSPALVRQGQVSELINAKPRARRRILEEAAGIAGLHARRHDAMLKLNSAESNLTRLLEILSQLEAREATLTREAERASRYRELSTELRRFEALLVYRRWREADRDRSNATEAMERTASDAGKAAQTASEAARRRIELEDAIPKLREDEAIARALHQKQLVEREALDTREREAKATIERLKRQIGQLTQDKTRQEAARSDAATTLERLNEEALAMADAPDAADEIAAAAEEEAVATEKMRAAEAALERLTADAAQREAERGAAQRRLDESRAALARLQDETRTAEEALAALTETRLMGEEAIEDARADAEEARMAAVEAEEAALDADEARKSAEEAAQALRSELAEAEGAVGAVRAEVAGLERFANELRAAANAIIDRVRVAPGVENALGAALGDDLEADELATGELGDGVIGWTPLPPYGSAPPLPAGAEPLSAHVDAPPALSRRLSQTGLVDRSQGAQLQPQLTPGQRLVSREGDLWRWDGYAAAAGAAPSSSALRLERLNALEDARGRFDAASAAAEAVKARHQQARDAADAARQRFDGAEQARKSAERRAAEAESAAGKASAEAAALVGRIASAEELLASRRRDAEAAETVREEAETALAEFAVISEGDDGAEALQAARATAEAARTALIAAKSAREGLDRQRAAQAERKNAIERDLADWTRRLDAATEQTSALAERAEDAAMELEGAEAAPLEIEERRAELVADIEQAHQRLASAVDALSKVEAELKQVAQTEKAAANLLAEAREGRARLEARAEAAQQRAEELSSALEEVAGCAPSEFLEHFKVDPDRLPPVKNLEQSISQLKRQRDALGAPNLRADQELKEVSEERESLANERDDLSAAIGKLRQGVSQLNKEGRERLLAAYEEVSANFTQLFTRLFNGGNARLTLIEADDPLEAGLEIFCEPPGKRFTSLNLLSGGEQTLSAMALILAVFMVNPAPVCVLDEVDAPLDDANVGRFCDLLDEMTRRTSTRFLIITHHAVSMSRMDRLFGVTMVEPGVSQLVSVDLETAVDLVDAA
ncbi:MAG: AAA family ATPase [Neomegalonema sp.]|nr:AAA family ATPase [Neomegalonema sp.]